MKNILLFLIMLLTVAALPGRGNAGEIDDALSNVKKQGKAVMLELGSEGCAPCEQMKPVMKKLSGNYKDSLEVIFVDVRKDRDMAKKFRVFAIPTQVFLDKTGKEFHRHMGYYSYDEIEAMLKKAGL